MSMPLNDPHGRSRFSIAARLSGCSLLVLGALIASHPAAHAAEETAAAPAADVPAASADVQTEEIIVTARRRAEKIQDVPIPMNVLSGDALLGKGAVRIEDIGRYLPSSNVTSSNPRQTSMAVRGLGNNPANEGLEGSVGLFIDGVYLGRPGMLVNDQSEIDQLEMLRGPQGTLFGKNTTAGALNLTTKKPTSKFEGEASATFGSYNDREFRGYVNAPIDDRNAVRISAYDTNRDGTLTSVATGQDLNNIDRQGMRVQVLSKPNDRVTNRFIADWHREADRQGAPSFYSTIAGAGYWNYIKQLRTDAAGQGLTLQAPAEGHDPFDRVSFANSKQFMKIYQGGLSDQIDWNLDSGYTLTSISGFRFWNFRPNNDSDYLNLDLQTGSGGRVFNNQWTQEVRLSSPTGGPVDYTVGSFFFLSRTELDQYRTYGSNTNLLQDFFGSWSNGAWAQDNAKATRFANKEIRWKAELATDSYSLFGQTNWHANDDLTFTLGLRENIERKRMDMWRDLGNTQTAAALATNPNYQTVGVNFDNNTWAGTIAANYKVTDGLSLFTSVASGAKSGAINATPATGQPIENNQGALTVQPEKIKEVDAGFKSEWLNRKLTFNANAFYALVKDYQATGSVYDSNTGKMVSTLINTGWVTSKGAEFDSSWRVAPGLRLNATGSYNLAMYRSFRDGTCAQEYKASSSAVCDLTGRQVVGAPRWVGSLGADYEWDVHDGITAYVGGDYSYRTGYFGTQDDSAFGRIPGYGLANVRIGSRINDDQIDVSLWVKNLFDTHYVTNTSIGSFGEYYANLGDPLMIGGTVRVKF